MRYHELITEGNGLPPFLNPNEPMFYKPAMAQMIATIKRSCKPYFEAIGYETYHNTLYRGMTTVGAGNNNRMGLKNIRTDGREPLATGQADHELLNQYFNEKYGHPYRNGLFVSGRKAQAEEYGDVYAIFPVGDFDFIWHDTISDLYVSVLDPIQSYAWWKGMAKDTGVIDNIRAEVEAEGIKPSSSDYMDAVSEGLYEWINGKTAADLIEHMGSYNTDNLKEGINSGHEIMIWAKQYYYVQEHVADVLDWKK